MGGMDAGCRGYMYRSTHLVMWARPCLMRLNVVDIILMDQIGLGV